MTKKMTLTITYIYLAVGCLTVTAFLGRQQIPAVVAVQCCIPCGQTVIIDAGHGGADGGAVSPSGVYESTVNLSIALKLRDLFRLFGISPIMTRESPEILYPPETVSARERKVYDQNMRLQLINSVSNGFLISIHQNKFPDAKPFGAQVLYAPTEGSEVFAVKLQEQLIATINPANYRSAAQISSDIYIMNNIECPAVLVECGFLSNPEEELLLQEDAYQTKLAAVIAATYLNSTEFLGGTNEG